MKKIAVFACIFLMLFVSQAYSEEINVKIQRLNREITETQTIIFNYKEVYLMSREDLLGVIRNLNNQIFETNGALVALKEVKREEQLRKAEDEAAKKIADSIAEGETEDNSGRPDEPASTPDKGK